jgi:chemotaxis protein CheZ
MASQDVETTADDSFEKLFGDKAKELVSRLEDNDVAGAVGLIEDLQKVRDQNLYQEIGRLTRALHESIKNFKLDSGVQGACSVID